MGAVVGWAVLAMEDAGFILGSYGLTFAVVGGFAWGVVRAGRKLSDQVDDEHKYWT